MGQIRKVGDLYYIEFYARGLMYSKAGGASIEEAQALLDKTEAQIASGEALTIARDIDLPVFFELFLQDAAPSYSAVSMARFRSAINHFSSFLNKEYPRTSRLTQITPSVIESYKSFLIAALKELGERGNPTKVNLTLLLLREILEYGIKTGFINDNPSLHAKLLIISQTSLAQTARLKLAKSLFEKGLTLGRISQLLELSDIAKAMYFSPVIPISRL